MSKISNLARQMDSIGPVYFSWKHDITGAGDGSGEISRQRNPRGGRWSQFTYDGLSRRVKIVEPRREGRAAVDSGRWGIRNPKGDRPPGRRRSQKNNGSVTSDSRFIYDGMSIRQKRDASNNVLRDYFASGFKEGSNKYFYVHDHLGSICSLFDNSAVERGRWDYSVWGERASNQITSNPIEPDFGYTGHYNHAPSGLAMSFYRPYKANIARWLSRDPIGEAGGIGLYGYVFNNPINLVDPLGLVDINNFNPESDAEIKSAYDNVNPSNIITYASHDGDFLKADYAELLKRFQNLVKYKNNPNMNIKLFICNGQDRGAVEERAKQLAKDLQRDIEIPNGYLNYYIEFGKPVTWVTNEAADLSIGTTAAKPPWKTLPHK